MTNEEKPKRLYHYQEEAIQQLLQRGETTSLVYIVTDKTPAALLAEAARD